MVEVILELRFSMDTALKATLKQIESGSDLV